MSENEDQSADFAQDAEVAPPSPQVTSAVQAGAGVGAQVQSNSRRRGEGRRVTLARHNNGYNLWMMSRHIQGFCAEWEDVTNFQLPEGIEQQVRIHVESVGEARPIRPEYSGQNDAPERAVEERLERAIAADAERTLGRLESNSPSPQNIPRRDLVQMFQELPAHNQEIIAGQIEANHREVQGRALLNIAHPEPNHLTGFANVVGDLRESVRHTLEILERLG